MLVKVKINALILADVIINIVICYHEVLKSIVMH